jgi:hypothetical protein
MFISPSWTIIGGSKYALVTANTYLSRLGFSYDGENTIVASIVNPWVVEVLTTSFLP